MYQIKIDAINTVRGRNISAEVFQTGNCSLRIIDQNGDFNPQNPASPYFTYLNPMRKLTITATYLGTTYPIFAGYITSYEHQHTQVQWRCGLYHYQRS